VDVIVSTGVIVALLLLLLVDVIVSTGVIVALLLLLLVDVIVSTASSSLSFCSSLWTSSFPRASVAFFLVPRFPSPFLFEPFSSREERGRLEDTSRSEDFGTVNKRSRCVKLFACAARACAACAAR
jgi:hypothetical protein